MDGFFSIRTAITVTVHSAAMIPVQSACLPKRAGRRKIHATFTIKLLSEAIARALAVLLDADGK